MKPDVITKVFNQGVSPVWILGPLDFWSTFRSGSGVVRSAVLNSVLGFSATFSWWHDGERQRADDFSHASNLAVCICKVLDLKWTVEVSS